MSSDYMEALRYQLELIRVLRKRQPATRLDADILRCIETATPVYLADWVEDSLRDAAVDVPRDVALGDTFAPVPVGFVLLSGRTALATPDSERFALEWAAWSAEPDGCNMFTGINALEVRGADSYGTFASSWPYGEPLSGHTAAWGGDGPLSGSNADSVDEGVRAFVYALWAFMRERRATTVTNRGVDRALRKQAERSGWTHEPIVQVVELRASEPRPHDADGEHASVDWACRWAVRGHWRQQPYPSKGIVQAKWIPAHVKGPEGKPLRAATKLLAVVR